MLLVWGSRSMMFFSFQILRQEVNAEWSELVGLKDRERSSVGIFKLGESMKITQWRHVIRLFSNFPNSEQVVS